MPFTLLVLRCIDQLPGPWFKLRWNLNQKFCFTDRMAEPLDISFRNVREKETQTAPITNFTHLLRLQSQEREKEKKSDRKRSGCQWTDRMFSKYGKCFEKRFDLEITPLEDDDDCLSKLVGRVKDEFKKRAKCVDNKFTGNTEEIPGIVSKLKSERRVRFFINDLLTEVVNQNDLCLRIEEPLTFPGLPTSIADYVIYTKTNEILGCVETKWSESFDKNAIVQCQLQLLSLHTKVNHSLFGIVTDAYGFIFIKLDANGVFHLEKETPIRIFENWAAFHETLGIINQLISNGINEAHEASTCTTREQGQFALKLICHAITIFRKAAKHQFEKGKRHLANYLLRRGFKIAKVWVELVQTKDQWKIVEDPSGLETTVTRGQIDIHVKCSDFCVVKRKSRNSSRREKSIIVVTRSQIRTIVQQSWKNQDEDHIVGN